MTVSPLRELLFLLNSLLLGCMSAVVWRIPCLFRGEAKSREEGALLYKKFPYPPSLKIKKGEKKKRKRGGKRIKVVLAFFKDLVFFLLLSAVYSVLVYAVHDGAFRLYSLGFLVLGFLCAKRLLTPLFLHLSRFLFTPLREGALFCILWCVYPVRLFLRGTSRFFFKIYAKIRAPFSFLCGILSKKITERRKKRQELHAHRVSATRRAAGRSLTGRAVPSSVSVGSRKEINELAKK